MRLYKKMLGVTLLEIMLVLAIAAVVITMSVRYFQQASANQRLASGLSVVSSVSAAVESFRLAGGQISDIATGILPFWPGGSGALSGTAGTPPKSPWTGEDVTLAASGGNYILTINMSATACPAFQGVLVKTAGFTLTTASCSPPITLTIAAS